MKLHRVELANPDGNVSEFTAAPAEDGQVAIELWVTPDVVGAVVPRRQALNIIAAILEALAPDEDEG